MSMAEFNQKYPSTIPIERLAVVNGLDRTTGSHTVGHDGEAGGRRNGRSAAAAGSAGGHGRAVSAAAS